ncbi:MAG: hypothetical protein R2880_11650 [Deinococcales bacterium]
MRVTLNRTEVTLAPRDNIEFLATVTGANNTNVIWRLGGGSADGTSNRFNLLHRMKKESLP